MAERHNLHIVDHPLVQDRLSRVRCRETKTPDFRKYLKEIAVLMGFAVTKDLPLVKKPIQTPVTAMEAEFLAKPEPVIIPILRAGLGLSDGLQEVLTGASIGHIGVYRDEYTKKPVEYLVKLPPDIAQSDVIIVDPMLATGHSALYAIDILVKQNVAPQNIKLMILVASPEGVKVIHEKYPDIKIFAAALDDHLNDDCYIVPGLGDAGDRLFGTE